MKDKKNKTKKGGIDEMRLCGAMFELEQFTSRSLGSDAATTTLVFRLLSGWPARSPLMGFTLNCDRC